MLFKNSVLAAIFAGLWLTEYCSATRATAIRATFDHKRTDMRVFDAILQGRIRELGMFFADPSRKEGFGSFQKDYEETMAILGRANRIADKVPKMLDELEGTECLSLARSSRPEGSEVMPFEVAVAAAATDPFARVHLTIYDYERLFYKVYAHVDLVYKAVIRDDGRRPGQ